MDQRSYLLLTPYWAWTFSSEGKNSPPWHSSVFMFMLKVQCILEWCREPLCGNRMMTLGTHWVLWGHWVAPWWCRSYHGNDGAFVLIYKTLLVTFISNETSLLVEFKPLWPPYEQSSSKISKSSEHEWTLRLQTKLVRTSWEIKRWHRDWAEIKLIFLP